MFPADEHPFLAAVLARPADDAPRLVYADYLDETGRPEDAARADLVRVQVALARLPRDHPRRAELTNRQADLHDRHAPTWTAALAGLGAEFTFRRGVPDTVALPAAAFVRRGDELFDNTEVAPGRSFVRRVRLRDPARVLPQLVRCPFLARVEELDLTLGDLGNGGVGMLVESPHLGAVRVLRLGRNGLADAGVAALSRAAALVHLHVLDLHDNDQITGDGAAALADSPFLAGLLELDLSGNEVTGDGVRALVAGRATARLHALKLAGNPVGDIGVVALARSEVFRRMLAGRDPHLDLRATATGPAGAAALAASPELDRVAGLYLGENDLGDRGADALLRSPLGNIRALRLARNQLTDAAALALAAAPLPKLRSLDLSGNRLTRRGIEALKAAAAARGFALDTAGNATAPAAAPVALADVVNGVLPHPPADRDDVAELKRRVTHPTRPAG